MSHFIIHHSKHSAHLFTQIFLDLYQSVDRNFKGGSEEWIKQYGRTVNTSTTNGAETVFFCFSTQF